MSSEDSLIKEAERIKISASALVDLQDMIDDIIVLVTKEREIMEKAKYRDYQKLARLAGEEIGLMKSLQVITLFLNNVLKGELYRLQE